MAKLFALIFAIIGLLIACAALQGYMALNEMHNGAQFTLNEHWFLGPLSKDMVDQIAKDPTPNIDAAQFVGQLVRRVYAAGAIGLAIVCISATVLLRRAATSPPSTNAP